MVSQNVPPRRPEGPNDWLRLTASLANELCELVEQPAVRQNAMLTKLMSRYARPALTSQKELVERASEAGALAYVVKPFTPNDLLPAIEIALARYEQIITLEAEVADVSGAGHMVAGDDNQVFAAAIEGFLDRHRL